jgi:hypothetical protein
MNNFLIANLLHFYRNHQRLRNLTLTVQISDISQSFVSATKYENISIQVQCGKKINFKNIYTVTFIYW